MPVGLPILDDLDVQALVFDGPPQPFNKDAVLAIALAIHTVLDAALLETPGKRFAGELDALVGTEDRRGTIAVDGLFSILTQK